MVSPHEPVQPLTGNAKFPRCLCDVPCSGVQCQLDEVLLPRVKPRFRGLLGADIPWWRQESCPGMHDPFFYLAMSNWQLARKTEARQWFDKGVAAMEKKLTNHVDVRSTRVEAAFLLGLTGVKQEKGSGK
jgi:hypothetical protein